MALKSTIYKADLNVADMDRQVYADFTLTLACHPSETEQRMMLRLLAFAYHASDSLEFGRGISTDEEPGLWQRDLAGNILLWIELGTPEPDRLRKACSRADKVILYAYGDRATPVWWEKHREALSRFPNLAVLQISDRDCRSLAELAAPRMTLQCTVSEGEALMSDGSRSVSLSPEPLRAA